MRGLVPPRLSRTTPLLLLAATALLLAPFGCSDGGAGGAADLAPVHDLAGADLAVRDQGPPADLVVPDDLTVLPDLVHPPDLLRPKDLAGGCGNGPPCLPNELCCMMGVRSGTCYDPRCLACCM